MVLFLFDNVIYVFLLLWLCIFIVYLCMTTLTENFPCFFLSCKANARIKTRKDGARPSLFLIFVLFYVFLCCFMYWLFCDVLCIVCVYMRTELLPPGGYPIAVKYMISYQTQIIFLQIIHFFHFITDKDSVYYAVQTKPSNWIRLIFVLMRLRFRLI
jgi:hypothetical protein